MRHPEADRELAAYWTSAVGLSAQGYEFSTDAPDPDARHLALRAPHHRRELALVVGVEASLAELDPAHYRVLRAVYHPHAWPTLLRIALTPRHGSGSLVALAVDSDRAHAAYAARFQRTGTPSTVLSFLLDEASRESSAALIRRLREEAEADRDTALAAYDALRLLRRQRSAAARLAELDRILRGAA